MSNSVGTDFTRIFDIITYQEKKYPQDRAFNYFENGAWNAVSIHALKERAHYLAYIFHERGFVKGNKLIIIPRSGMVEWVALDMACMYLGIVLVPLHYTTQPQEFQRILRETEAVLCVTADSGLYYKLRGIAQEEACQIFHIQRSEAGFFKPLTDKIPRNLNYEHIEKVKYTISPEDLATIMYTSGTSEQSKGVMLTHSNIVSNIMSILSILPLKDGNRVISFLPFSHIFERVACYVFITFGTEIYFCQSREAMVHDFKTVRPVFFTSVPRVLEKMYGYLQEKAIGQRPFKRQIINWAIKTGKKYDEKIRNPLYLLKLCLARLLVFRWWKMKLGGKIRYIAVGAAALHPDIARLFSAAGIRVVVGYGMTETSPIITVNRFSPGLNRFGTVGFPVPGVEITINNPDVEGQGEILVKGPNVTQGYFKRPDLTAKAFTSDGWLKTGDIGKLTDRNFLVITDRNKDIFKTTSGKFISPQSIENHLQSSAFILQSMVIGFNKPHVAAIIIPDSDILKSWCIENKIHWTETRFMVHNIKVIEKIQEEVDAINELLPNYQRVRKISLQHEEWLPENDLLTASFKLKRSNLEIKYKPEIEKLFSA
ncbi:MAG TPA: long-chain fatty acid--CoA ligase [Saprospiraceae bacterium]|nr:long-chain fatty acid--CoA ligase [Saprospiraceae bacterium]